MKFSDNVTGCCQKPSFNFQSKMFKIDKKNITICVKRLKNEISNAQIKFGLKNQSL